jgi:hypothetical protein
MATMISRLATALLGGCLAFASATAGAALAWFSDDNGVLQVADQRFRRVAVVTGIQGLAATRDGGAWAISEDRVLRFASDGSTRVEVDLTHQGYGRAERLAVDPYDDSAWIGTDARLLLHISHAGEVIQGISFDEGRASFVIALDRTIWALADGRLLHRTLDGSQLDVPKQSLDHVTHLAVDSLRRVVWVADADGVQRISLDGEAMRAVTTSPVSALALDLRGGNLWVAGDDTLMALDANGDLRAEIPLPAGRSGAIALLFDDDDDTLFVKGSDSLLRVGRDGRVSASAAVAESMVLAIPAPTRILPTIALVRPPAGGATYERFPDLTIRLAALCSDKPCDLPDYVDRLLVSVDVDGVPAIVSGRGTAALTVAALPDVPMHVGPNRVTMRATDPFGNEARTSASITVLERAKPDAPTQAFGRLDKHDDQVPLAPKAANKAPTISLTSPLSGSVFTAGATIALTASATDPDGTISKVEFYRGGTTLLGTTTTVPYQVSWQVVPPGNHVFTAKAYDNRNGTAVSAPVSVTVVANQTPAVTVTSPGQGTFFEPGATVPLTAVASDADGDISRVDFFDRATLIGTATTSPFAFSWTTASSGRHSITARATDDKGGTGISASVDIVVGQTPIVIVKTPIACSFIDGATVVDLLLSADAMSTTGRIARVDFFDGGSLVGTSFSAPWNVTLVGAVAGLHTITARATDDRGLASISRPAAFTVRPPNQFPSVALVAPSDGARFALGSPITMQATASDNDGTIKAVEFHSNGSGGPLLARLTSPPYAATTSTLPAGNVSIVAVAIDDRDALTASIPARITIAANLPPAVQLTAPAPGATFSAPANIALAATASDTDGSVARVDFYAGANLIGSTTSSPYTLAWNPVPAGTYAITAKATDNSGAVNTSSVVSVTVTSNAAPTVTLQSPVPGGPYFAPTTIQLSANASDSDGSITRVDFVANGTTIGSATVAPYAFVWDSVAGGLYSIVAVATDNQGATTTSAAVAVSVLAEAAIQIDAGLDGSTVDDDTVLVSGTIQAPANSGVLVNGVLAQVDSSGRFFANAVPLTTGSNGLTITVAGQDGQATSSTVNVSSTGPAPFAITAAPTDGLAPLRVTFEITNRTNRAFQRVEFDFNGDGTADFTADRSQFVDGAFTLFATYPAGTSTSRVTIYDSNNAVIQTTTRVIVARTLLEQDNLLRGVYQGMLERLRAGKITAAVTAISGDLQNKYASLFTAFGANLSATIDGLGAIEPNWYTVDRAEYVVIRDTQGSTQGFLIDFARGSDGIWRIYGM